MTTRSLPGARTQRLDRAVVTQASNVNTIGQSAWQSTVSACHWCSPPKSGRITFVVSVRLAGRTHGWADRSGDSDARRLATNCQKANSKTVSPPENGTFRVAACAAGGAVLAARRSVAGRTPGAYGSGMTLILDE